MVNSELGLRLGFWGENHEKRERYERGTWVVGLGLWAWVIGLGLWAWVIGGDPQISQIDSD